MMTSGPVSGGSTLLLAPELLGSVDRFMLMARHRRVEVDHGMRFDKRVKPLHRFTIADTRGRLDITVPVARPASYHSTRVGDILISGHSPWWDTAMTALESAYGRTPFFEFYADDFRPFFSRERVGTPLSDLSEGLERTICRLTGIGEPVRYAGGEEAAGPVCDLRRGYERHEPFAPYWQVRALSLGFIPHLSIVDLLFNVGPEAALYLHSRR